MKNGTKIINFKKRRIVCSLVLLGIFIVIITCTYYACKKPVALGKNHEYVNFLYETENKKYKLDELSAIRKSYEDNLNIQDVDYTWAEELNYKNKPEMLIIHHTADSGITPERMNEIHIENGWAGIGYHFYIRTDGTIYRGRPENAVGAHAKRNNKNSIGIALEGNFEKDNPTEAQMKSLVKLSADMIIKYNLNDVLGNRDVYETLCPGENLSIEDLKDRISNELISIYKEKNNS